MQTKRLNTVYKITLFIKETYQMLCVHGFQIAQPLVHELLENILSTTDCLEKGNTEGYQKILGQNKRKQK